MSDTASPPPLELSGRPDEVPSAEQTERMRRCARLVEDVMVSLDCPVVYSPLGPEWSSDIDLYAGTRHGEAVRLAEAAGWLSLESIGAHLGHGDSGRWAVVDDGEVVAACDIKSGAPPPPAQALLDRVHRLGNVRLREALETRQLVAAGKGDAIDGAILASAARIEADLGGDTLREYLGNESPQPGRRAWLRAAVRRSPRPRPRVSIALSGVDGAGKSTLADWLVAALERCGTSASVVWTRPGMRLGLLERLASTIKRSRGREGTALRDIASGTPHEELVSRRGIIGWVWSLLVVLAYLWDVNRRTRAARGVVVFDRHVLDAVATMGAVYGSVASRLHVWLIRRLCPRADITFLLEIDGDAAAARKPGDLISPHLVARQLERYAEAVDIVPGVIRLDALRPVAEQGREVLRSTHHALAGRRRSRFTRLVDAVRLRL